MQAYRYKAIDGTGRKVSGEMQADSPDQANERVAAKGLTPVSVSVMRQKKAVARSGGRVTAEELILFTTQLATMLRAGVPILRAVEILETETENMRLKATCAAMAGDIRSGLPLHAALERHPDVFSKLYRNMVAAGESSGALPDVLTRLIYVISHENQVRSEIRAALQYPIMVVVALTAAMSVLLATVVPRFADVFRGAGVELPLPTRICIGLSDLLQQYWIGLLVGLALLAAGVSLVRRTEPGRFWIDRTLLHLPYVGRVLIKSLLSRFAGVFSILQASGVGMLESMDILSGTLGNRAVVREFEAVQQKLERGQGLSKPLASARYFTPMFVSMVAIGEETGRLDEMLREIANHYDTEVGFATKRMTGAIGPILIVMLAAVVGFFALAVYMPMWDLGRIAMQGGG